MYPSYKRDINNLGDFQIQIELLLAAGSFALPEGIQKASIISLT